MDDAYPPDPEVTRRQEQEAALAELFAGQPFVPLTLGEWRDICAPQDPIAQL